jgi:hypothetical protein
LIYKPRFIKLFHLFNCCSRQQFTWGHIWTWRNAFFCNSFLGLPTPAYFHNHRTVTDHLSRITIRIWTISLTFSTLCNWRHRSYSIVVPKNSTFQERHKRTTAETASVTNCRIAPHINSSHYDWNRRRLIFFIYGSFDFFEFLFQMLRPWQLFGGKWWLCYWLALFKETKSF